LRSFSHENFTFDLFEKFPPDSRIGKFYQQMKGLQEDSPQKAELQKTLREIVQHPAGEGHFSIVVSEEDKDWLKQETVDGTTVYDLVQAVISNPQMLPNIPGIPEEEFKKTLDEQREKFEKTYDLFYQAMEASMNTASMEEQGILMPYLMMLDEAKAKALKTKGNLSLNGYMSAFVSVFVDQLKKYENMDPSKMSKTGEKMVRTFTDLQDMSLTIYREGLLLWHWHTSQLRSVIARDTQDEISRAKAKTDEYIAASEKYWASLPSGSQLRMTADISYQFVSRVRDALENMKTAAEQGQKNTTHSYRWIINQAIDETLKMKSQDERKLYRPLLQEIAHSIIRSAEIELPSVDVEQGVDLFVHNILTPSQYRTLYNHFKGRLRNIITTEGSLASHYVFLASSDGVGVVIVDRSDLPKEIKDGQEVSVTLNDKGKTEIEIVDATAVIAQTKPDDVISKTNMAKVYGGDPGSYVMANADTEKESKKADENFARGLGLVRSENQLEDADIPGRMLYRERWLAMARALSGKPLTIRAFDWKDDKKTTMLFHVTFKGAKMYLEDAMGREIVKEQLRALIDLRNQGYENIRFMFPMVETADDIRAIKAIIAEVLAEAEFADLKGKFPVEWGIMIETEKALTNLGDFLQEKDLMFFSIGTNDLTSELYQVNRSDPKANKYFDSIYPRILQAVVSVIGQASLGEGRKVTICGELASKQRFWIIRSILRDMDIHFGLSMPSNDIPVFNGVTEALKNKAVRDLPEFKALQQHIKEIAENKDPSGVDEKYLDLITEELRAVNVAIENAMRKAVASELGIGLSKQDGKGEVNSSVLASEAPSDAAADEQYGGVDFTGYRSTTVIQRQDEPVVIPGPLLNGEGITTLGGEAFAGFSFDILSIVPYTTSF